MKKIFITALLCSIIAACSDDNDNTTTGNPLVALSIAPQVTSLEKSGQNSKLSSDFVSLASLKELRVVEPFQVRSLQMCFKRLRFKKALDANSPEEDNIDINLGLVDIPSSGIELTEVNVPSGDYIAIEFDLEKDCEGVESIPSVYLDNDNDGGTPFQTDDRITIKFNGNISIKEDTNIVLEIDRMKAALDTVTLGSEIKSVLEDIDNEGGFFEN